jgi:hypothetical protein
MVVVGSDYYSSCLFDFKWTKERKVVFLSLQGNEALSLSSYSALRICASMNGGGSSCSPGVRR